MFGDNREQLRQMYQTAWQKSQQQQPLTPLETQIADVVKEHPEYHTMLSRIEQDFMPEMGQTNPFLHMGMHLGLREQLSTNRPAGIISIYQSLLKTTPSSHEAEHKMMECLGEALWTAQRNNTAPDDAAYLKCLKSLTK